MIRKRERAAAICCTVLMCIGALLAWLSLGVLGARLSIEALPVRLSIEPLEGMARPAFAMQKDANNMPVTSEISLRHIVAGGPAKAGTATFILTAKTEKAPMPAGSRDGTKMIEQNGTGIETFGTITYTRPDIYEYTVRRQKRETANAEESCDRYRVRVIVLNSGEVKQVVTKEDSGKKAELNFADIAMQGTPVDTGDEFTPLIAGLLIAAALTAVLSLLTSRRRKRCGSG